MIDQIRKLTAWVQRKPWRIAVFVFLVYVPIHLLIRLFAHAESFITETWIEVRTIVLMGLVGAIVGYFLAKFKQDS
jgi:hypothetical protein